MLLISNMKLNFATETSATVARSSLGPLPSNSFLYLVQIQAAPTLHSPARFASSLRAKPKDFLDLAYRPGAVAWIVSKCSVDSEREKYVGELRKHIYVGTLPKKLN